VAVPAVAVVAAETIWVASATLTAAAAAVLAAAADAAGIRESVVAVAVDPSQF
jgi:hypothetical protein